MNAAVNVPIDIRLADPDPARAIDVVFTGPDGAELRLPAFRRADGDLVVRFAGQTPGEYSYRVLPDGEAGSVTVVSYSGDNPLYRRGRLGVSSNKRHLVHRDGHPFFWLADTWWMGLTKRLEFPADFQRLLDDRTAKGFTVVQIVAGLYPDMPAFDERGANEVGFPWTEDFSGIVPGYFDAADERIRSLVENGVVPCIVGSWGYFLPWMGVERMKQHWRNLVARYAALPVVFCLAGEAVMPYYLSEAKDEDAAVQKRGWTDVARYVRSIDAYANPVTAHPTQRGWEQLEEPYLMDFEMLQTGHGDRASLPFTNAAVTESYRRAQMPVLNSEVCYEGIGEASRQDVQRYAFWICMLSGACGHTYGANGIWQVNSVKQRYGPSPHGMEWGDTPWEEAYHLPGSAQVAQAKGFLERYPWHELEPHQEWVEPSATEDEPLGPYAAGCAGRLLVVYFPSFIWGGVVVSGLEPGARYSVVLYDPVRGSTHDRDAITAGQDGSWLIPREDAEGTPKSYFPMYQDWAMVLELM